MRISSTQYHQTMNTALQDASSKVGDLMQKMASGMRVLRPSDEPITSVRLSRLTREEAALTQYRDNIAALASRLSRNESYLGGMTNDLMQARDLLIWAANGGNTSDDLNAMANSLKALRDSLFYTTNTKDQEGRYLFSGTATNTATVEYDAVAPLGSRYSFTGNNELQHVVVGKGITQAANVSLSEMAAFLNQLDDTIDALDAAGADVNDAGTRARITAGMDHLDEVLNSLTQKIAKIGGGQNILSTLEDNHANISLSNKQAYIALGQLDYGDAAVKLNGYTMALQATQKAYAKVIGLSLFDVI